MPFRFRFPSFLSNKPRSPERKEIPPPARILVMLGSRMQKQGASEEWSFPLFTPGPVDERTGLPGEISGGASRMRAVEAEYDREIARPESSVRAMRIFVTGGPERKTGQGESRAEEAASQLRGRYGLPGESVVALTSGGSTLGNAAIIAEYLKTHEKELGSVKEIEIVTNDYHMLRAWLMFSQAMRKAMTGSEADIPQEAKETVRQILTDGSPEADAWTPANMKETRKRAMAVLAPYFEDSVVRIVPRIVEEALAETKDGAKERYARMLENSLMVRKTLAFEYKGVMDLLEGRYES